MIKSNPRPAGNQEGLSNQDLAPLPDWRERRYVHRGGAPSLVAILLLATAAFSTTSAMIQEQIPNLLVIPDDLESQSFHGNQSHVDYFRLLQRDGNSLLIGARNYVYNISTRDLSENVDRRIEWVSRKVDSAACFSKGKSEGECHNYIRVLAKKSNGEFLVCGTNAYKPTCRDYLLLENGTFVFEESLGVGKSPFDPRHNSTFVFAEGRLYSGTVVDFQGMKPTIFRDPLKTDFSDYRQLNGPDFVHSFEYGDYVFFFFRETAVEYMNCGKRVYSRVARVCKGDHGIEQQRSNGMSTWTSFLKSRLNCSFPGDYPFYFDEIQSVSDVILGVYSGANNEVIYAIFTTPQNSIPGSAVCAFSMRDILDVFEGPFKEQKDLNSNWLSVPQHKVPEPRPGTCVNDSRTLPPETVNFVKAHPLMDELVSPFMGKPLLMKATFKYRFTKLTVDPQVPLSSRNFVDVVFIATDIGMILKVINTPADTNYRQVHPIVIEEIYAFEPPVSINNLQIAKDDGGVAKLIIITDLEVKAIPLERCHKVFSCHECVGLQDPYCGWYPDTGSCEAIQKNSAKRNFLQNVTSGVHRLCPDHFEATTVRSSSSQAYETGGGHEAVFGDLKVCQLQGGQRQESLGSHAPFQELTGRLGDEGTPAMNAASLAKGFEAGGGKHLAIPTSPSKSSKATAPSTAKTSQSSVTKTPTPPQEVADTCPPCVCAQKSTSPIPPIPPKIPLPIQDPPSKYPYGRGLSNSPEEGVSGLSTEMNVENEIGESILRESKYFTNNAPITPHVTRGEAQSTRRGSKDLLLTNPREKYNNVAIAYSEGVTGPVVGASLGGPLIYSAETLAIAVTTACVAALVIGFISGFLFSRKCRGDDYPHFSDTPYLDSKLNKCENTADPNMYTANNSSFAPPKQINNLVANYNPKNINKSNAGKISADTKLIKPAKCAYI